MQFRGEISDRQRPLPLDGQFSNDRQDAFAGEFRDRKRCGREEDNLVEVLALARLIRREFRKGDPIGITFVGTPFLFFGIFKDIVGDVLVIKNLFYEDTISFVPLEEVASVTAGICPRYMTDGPVPLFDQQA